jgi:hypothetical protein
MDVETGSTTTASTTIFVHFCFVRRQMFAFNSRVSLANHWSSPPTNFSIGKSAACESQIK